MKTRSYYLNAPWRTECRTVELPDAPAAGDVLIKVEACGICGSDLTAAQTNTEWKPFGHEIAAVVRAVGAGESRLAVGDRVVLETSGFCGQCDLCRDGRVDLCRRAPGFWGRPAMGFADFMTAPAGCCVKYEGLTPDVASLTEPAGVAMDMVKVASIELGDRVAIIGPGPIALMAIPLALRRGAREVVCIGPERTRRRLDVAAGLGARVVVVDGALDDEKALRRSFDRVLLTSPAITIPAALELLDYGGIMAYIGIGPGSARIEIDANQFHFRKLQLRSSFASPAVYFPATLAMLKANIIPGEQFISHRFDLGELPAAMELARDRKGEIVKIVVTTGNGRT